MDLKAQQCLSHVDAAQAALEQLGSASDAAGLAALRAVVAGYPDTGSSGAGDVVSSLFMLLEHLIADGRMDREAVQVHVSAWRLMLISEPDPEATEVLLMGLKAIRARGVHAKAA